MAKTFPCTMTSIPAAVDFVKEYLEGKNFSREAVSKTLLRLEDVVYGLIGKANDPKEKFAVLFLRKYGFGGKTRVIIRCRGSLLTVNEVVQPFDFEGLGDEAVQIMNKRMLPFLARGLILRYRFGINTAILEVGKGRVSRLARNLLIMLGGVAAGILLRLLLPENAASFFAAEIFGTVTTVFFNLLKMIVAPLVFFSILTSISGFTDLGGIGNISVKTVGLFVFFSLAALLIGYGVFTVMPSGDPAIQAMLDCPSAAAAAESTSSLAWQNTKSFLLSIFPSNLLGAFVENNVLAVIFIALLTGTAVAKLRPENAGAVTKAIDAGSELIAKLTASITGTMPVLIFCSLGKLAMTVNVSLLGTLAKYLGAVAIGFALMVGFYLLALLVCGINPLEFLKGYSPAIFTAFTLASSAATVPVSLDCCVKNLKLPKSITYFVIPLGSTINMSGSCIMLLISCLFLAKVFCVEVTFTMMIPVMLMLLLLSMAAPGVPGSMVIMLASVLPVINVPAEAANVTVWFSALIGMMMVPVNSMGDAVTAMIVSKWQGKKKEA